MTSFVIDALFVWLKQCELTELEDVLVNDFMYVATFVGDRYVTDRCMDMARLLPVMRSSISIKQNEDV